MSYIYPDVLDLNLNGDTFNALKTDFNKILKRTLSSMENKGSEFAELTVKVKIKLEKETDYECEMPREFVKPRFDHKVSSVMQIKDELTGTLRGNYELIWDEDRGEYIMREMRQMTIFDICREDEYKDDEPIAAAGRKVISLPAPKEDDDDGDGDGANDIDDSANDVADSANDEIQVTSYVTEPAKDAEEISEENDYSYDQPEVG